MPNLSAETLAATTILGASRLQGRGQPAGSGCSPSSSSVAFDGHGNVSSSTDFNGHISNYTYDLSRNFQTRRVDASGTPSARTISTAWHVDWHLPTKVAEPEKMTTWVYNGQADPTSGNVVASCAPSAAVLPDGKPIVVPCKRIEQATTDVDGSQGLSAAFVGNPRIWAWTYNADGQVLTAKGPRTDVDDTTRYVYRTASDTANPMKYRRGDLYTVTDPLAHVTTVLEYDLNGRMAKVVEPNGLTLAMTYSPRGWLTSRVITGGSISETSSYEYDSVGQLTKVTQPDATYVSYAYDSAHRITDVRDSLGNWIHYELDNKGNHTEEQIKDPSGTLSRNVHRIYDALNRLQAVTGALQ